MEQEKRNAKVCGLAPLLPLLATTFPATPSSATGREANQLGAGGAARPICFGYSGADYLLQVIATSVSQAAIVGRTPSIRFRKKLPTVFATLCVCALSLSGAIFLILELDHPFGGFIQVSGAPLRSAIAQLGQ
jgi:hypothetical protein